MSSYSDSATPHRSLELKLGDQSGEQLLGTHTDLVRALHKAAAPMSVTLTPRANSIQITGDKGAVLVARRLLAPLRDGRPPLALWDKAMDASIEAAVEATLREDFFFRLKGVSRPVEPKSLAQVAFLQSLLSPSEKFIVGVGPTGTGKTHIALAAALNQLSEEHVKRVVVTKPHVIMEGEVVTPTARRDMDYDDQFESLEDILCDLIGCQEFRSLVELRKLELVPLGHFRGRIFNDSFIIIDEAQNMTARKMRTALTRMGRASRMVVTGDPEHTDLRGEETSGLTHLLDLLQGTDIAKVFRFQPNQIIHNDIVSRLEQLYARDKSEAANSTRAPRSGRADQVHAFADLRA